MIQVLVSFVAGYLVGSVPFAFLVTRRAAHVDIRKSGSGNVGGYNAYVVTQSKLTGLLVMVLDALKGFVAVSIALWLYPSSYMTLCVAMLGALSGHIYPMWLGFKGGRGLATAAGGMAVLGGSYGIVWCITWFIAKKLKCDILRSNLVAILVTPPILWIIPWNFVRSLIAVRVENDTFLFFSCVLSAVLLASHQDVIREIWKGTRTNDIGPSSTS